MDKRVWPTWRIALMTVATVLAVYWIYRLATGVQDGAGHDSASVASLLAVVLVISSQVLMAWSESKPPRDQNR